MAKVRLWMFRASLLSSIQVVHQRSHHSSLCAIRLGRRYPSSLEDFCSRLYFILLRYRLCYGPLLVELGPCRALQRCLGRLLLDIMERILGL